MSMSLFYYCLCGFFCCCRCFNPSLSFVAISAVLCCCFKVISVSVFYYCLCAFLCRCQCFNPSLCHLSPFLLSYVAVSRSCQCQYFTIVFVLFSVAVTVLTHLCVICRHFCCPVLLFQGHVVCWNFTPTWASLKMKKWSSQCTQLCNCINKPEKKRVHFTCIFGSQGKKF